MKRAALIGALLVAAAVPIIIVVVRAGSAPERTPEVGTKDAIFCVQRVTRRAVEADDFDAMQQVESSLRAEAQRLRELRAELATLPPPSRWERSRMRKHRPLAESALENWTAAADDLRQRVEGGAVPPHLRGPLLEALDEFHAARAAAWEVLILAPE